ncbi:hypothetical protein PoB_001165600 [Plakobranchus ocellatus]|uniref:WSC domain-containing protein n=1 Tax=Plakobranchus ocellatus TaxID=259542 RepID=A0AAV3YRZ3_9GAST|nr:hypothetical protein PoB_001165600 [Plakobranchus ocellatus]
MVGRIIVATVTVLAVCSVAALAQTTAQTPIKECESVHIGYRVDDKHWGIFGGCYHSKGVKGGVFPRTTIVNFKLQIDWWPWIQKDHGGDIIQKCGQEAVKKGYAYFGLQYYGDCYMGNTPDLSQGLVTSADCDKKCIWDVGAIDTMVVYKLENY